MAAVGGGGGGRWRKRRSRVCRDAAAFFIGRHTTLWSRNGPYNEPLRQRLIPSPSDPPAGAWRVPPSRGGHCGAGHRPLCPGVASVRIRKTELNPPPGGGGRRWPTRHHVVYRDRSAATAARPRSTRTSCGRATGASRPSTFTASDAAQPPPARAAPTSGAQRPDAWCATRRRTPHGTSRCGARASAELASTRWAAYLVSHPTYDETTWWRPWPPASARTRAVRLRPGVSRSRGDNNNNNIPQPVRSPRPSDPPARPTPSPSDPPAPGNDHRFVLSLYLCT